MKRIYFLNKDYKICRFTTVNHMFDKITSTHILFICLFSRWFSAYVHLRNIFKLESRILHRHFMFQHNLNNDENV